MEEPKWNYGLTGTTDGPKVLRSTACIACGYDDRPRVSGLFHRVTTSDHHLRSALVKRSRCKELIVRPELRSSCERQARDRQDLLKEALDGLPRIA